MPSLAPPSNHRADITILALGAHPDDIEFGCGGVIAKESRLGRKSHFVICSRGESGSHGTPAQRSREAKTAADILGASLEFVNLGTQGAGDAQLEPRAAHALKLAGIIRRTKPAILLAPTPVENQHPDHAALGTLARNAARLARYGGIKQIRIFPPHAIDVLLFYAITPDAEPTNNQPILIVVSDPGILDQWTLALQAHASQMKTRNYLELQLTRARLNGLRAGIGHAFPLFSNDSLVLDSLVPLNGAARRF